jgi:hypothetical protein
MPMLPRRVRNSLFKMAKSDVLAFLDDHQEELVRLFVDEIRRVDARVPEERAFIDLRMAALGEELVRAVFAAMRRFVEDF